MGDAEKLQMLGALDAAAYHFRSEQTATPYLFGRRLGRRTALAWKEPRPSLSYSKKLSRPVPSEESLYYRGRQAASV